MLVLDNAWTLSLTLPLVHNSLYSDLLHRISSHRLLRLSVSIMLRCSSTCHWVIIKSLMGGRGAARVSMGLKVVPINDGVDESGALGIYVLEFEWLQIKIIIKVFPRLAITSSLCTWQTDDITVLCIWLWSVIFSQNESLEWSVPCAACTRSSWYRTCLPYDMSSLSWGLRRGSMWHLSRKHSTLD